MTAIKYCPAPVGGRENDFFSFYRFLGEFPRRISQIKINAPGELARDPESFPLSGQKNLWIFLLLGKRGFDRLHGANAFCAMRKSRHNGRSRAEDIENHAGCLAQTTFS